MLCGKLLAWTECSGNPKIIIMGYYSSYIYILILLFLVDLYWWNDPDFDGFVCPSVSTSSEDPLKDLELLFG